LDKIGVFCLVGSKLPTLGNSITLEWPLSLREAYKEFTYNNYLVGKTGL